MRRVLQVALLLLLAGFAYLNVDYWRDPVYWRRWWDLVTHLQPDYMNFAPTVTVRSAAPLELPRAAPDSLTIAAASLDAAEAFAAEMDSFSLVVIHRGVVQREWYAAGWDRERLTQSQSMMKTLTAVMVGLAIEDGHIGAVTDPVARYLPEWRDDPRGAIRIADLLEMSSGLAQYRFTLNPFAADSSFRFLNSSDRGAVLLRTPLAWPPGSRFDYNDANAQLAGMLVERAAGRPYAAYFRERFWEPLGGGRAELWLDREGGSVMTACCLLATAMDWAKVGLLFKDHGRIAGRQVVPAAWIDAMTRPTSRYPGYGYFTWLLRGVEAAGPPRETPDYRATAPALAPDLIMLLGYGGQRVYISRDYDLVVVRLGPFAGMAPLAESWDNTRLVNAVIRGIRP